MKDIVIDVSSYLVVEVEIDEMYGRGTSKRSQIVVAEPRRGRFRSSNIMAHFKT